MVMLVFVIDVVGIVVLVIVIILISVVIDSFWFVGLSVVCYQPLVIVVDCFVFFTKINNYDRCCRNLCLFLRTTPYKKVSTVCNYSR